MTDQTIAAKGGCLCGNVTYVALVKPNTGACHCGMCRKWSAGPFMSVHVDGQLVFTGEQNISVFRSSEWAERGFCKVCGSNLYYKLLPRAGFPNGELNLSAGSIAKQDGLVFDHEVFVDHAPSWYHFADQTSRQRMTEAQLIAQYEVSDE